MVVYVVLRDVSASATCTRPGVFIASQSLALTPSSTSRKTSNEKMGRGPTATSFRLESHVSRCLTVPVVSTESPTKSDD